MDKKSYKNIYGYYLCLLILFFAAFAPHLIISLTAACVLMIYLCLLYSARKKHDPETQPYQHIQFLIGTFWKVNAILAVLLIIGGVYFMKTIDPSATEFCLNFIQERAMQLASITDMSALRTALAPCETQFIDANITALIITTVIIITPSAAYLIYRCAFGIKHLKNGLALPLKVF